ncbi:MAG: NAD-glutamate dehydrogenase, partial [Acidobacteria bacterium]|nr:NAD-glutamate dehydrogenase [Acidobacteriota bacterium]
MISGDAEKRKAQLAKVMETLGRRSAAEDRELVRAFAEVDFAETPDRIALRISPEAMAERILGHFRFVARTMPPSIQLYRGLPGIHVSVRRPTEEEARAEGAGEVLPLESTVVETHTPDVPFIFDSLKNYFAKAGLRVFCAVHPIFTVRRQWERIAWIGGPHDDGGREVYCNFQIEPVDSAERLRRIEHEIFSVLKCVFLAVEDFPDMLRQTEELISRLQSHPRGPSDLESAQAFLRWLKEDNYIFLGMAHHAVEAGGRLEQVRDSVAGVFADPALLPVVFPGFLESVETNLRPETEDFRIVDIDYCNNASAIYHLEPIDGILIREWKPEGALAGVTFLLGRFARSALMQRADRIPLLREKIDWIVRESGAPPNSHIYREMITTFNRLPMAELFYADPAALKSVIEPIIFMLGDDEISVRCRAGGCYEALSVAYSRLRYSYETEKNLLQALAAEFGPISFHTSSDCGAATVLLCYFDSSRLDRSLDPALVHRIAEQFLASWETRTAAALEAVFGDREGRRLFRLYVRR